MYELESKRIAIRCLALAVSYHCKADVEKITVDEDESTVVITYGHGDMDILNIEDESPLIAVEHVLNYVICHVEKLGKEYD